MPIVKCSASKATPAKGINYIMDPEKVIAKGHQGFVTHDPKQMAHQMLQTMHLHHKGFDPEERKYYHAKVAFDPKDRPENGGTLDPMKANDYAAKYAAKTWPGREVVWAVQDHGSSIHIHFIVAACEQETGKKLDARDAEYRAWKDQAQDLAKEFGLSTLDWRKATKAKRGKENQGDFPIKEDFAEKGRKNRGKTAWKDDLREIIDQAAASSYSMTEFRTALEGQGVTLTRCTEQTISYKLGDHKACRGDTLGGDYTVAAIRNALEHNRQDPVLQEGRKRSLNDKISGASTGVSANRKISQEERQQLRELGRLAGFKRSEIDEMCDRASQATWAEKQEAWADYKAARDEFWEEYNIRSQAIQNELNEAYKRRRMAKQMEWALDPRNRRKSLFGIIFAAIFLAKNDDVFFTEIRIGQLKREQEQLRKDMVAFKSTTGEAVETLREKGHSLDAYMASIKQMQKQADEIQRKNAATLDIDQREQLRRQAEQRKNRPQNYGAR